MEEGIEGRGGDVGTEKSYSIMCNKMRYMRYI